MEFAVNKPIVVVLSANSELGLGLVESLLKAKEWDVYSTFRKNSEPLNNVYERNEENPQKRIFQADLSKWNEISGLFEKIAAIGQIWGAINCAGEATAKTIKNLSTEEVTHSLQTNAVSAFNVTKCGLDTMSRNSESGGRIIHLSSVVVRRPVLGVVPYAMSKSAIEGLVKASAGELGRKNITINALRLGYFDRGMAKRDVPIDVLTEISGQNAVRKLGTPENLSSAIDYLLSPTSSFQTGSIIDLDGGLI